jgi:citrate synthase
MNFERSVKIEKGLENIYIGTTKISEIDGREGKLTYRGKDISDIIDLSYGQSIYWLLKERIPSREEEFELDDFLFQHMSLKRREVEMVTSSFQNRSPMKLLQGLLPLLDLDSDLELHSFGPDEQVGLVISAKIAAILSLSYRLGLGKKRCHPKRGLSFHQNFLHCLHGKLPNDLEVRTLNTLQQLQLEHGLNASTFSCLVTSSTLAPIEVALSAGIGTLFGKLHGGADQAALETAMKIDDIQKVEPFVLNALKKKQKIMGMGHRIYKTLDPRSKILKPMAYELTRNTPFQQNFDKLKKIEEVMQREMKKKKKEIWANLEFYKGIVFQSLGIPIPYFTAMFAMARVIGYTAHIVEYKKENKLIRPKLHYIGK